MTVQPKAWGRVAGNSETTASEDPDDELEQSKKCSWKLTLEKEDSRSLSISARAQTANHYDARRITYRYHCSCVYSIANQPSPDTQNE